MLLARVFGLILLIVSVGAQTPGEVFDETRLVIALSALVFILAVATAVTGVQVWHQNHES